MESHDDAEFAALIREVAELYRSLFSDDHSMDSEARSLSRRAMHARLRDAVEVAPAELRHHFRVVLEGPVATSTGDTPEVQESAEALKRTFMTQFGVDLPIENIRQGSSSDRLAGKGGGDR